MFTLRTPQRQLPRLGGTVLRRRPLAALAAGALLLGISACGPGETYSQLENYSSQAQRNIDTVAGYQIEAIRQRGTHLGYEETMRVAKAHDIEIVAGASRSENVISAQLQNAAAGVVPLAAPDGDDCVMLIIRYPAQQSGITETTLTWLLIEDYVRNTETVASGVCSGESYSSLSWSDLPEASDPSRPLRFEH